jgi:hypothetical protein
VPEWGPLGSVRGAFSNERPYREYIHRIDLLGHLDVRNALEGLEVDLCVVEVEPLQGGEGP